MSDDGQVDVPYPTPDATPEYSVHETDARDVPVDPNTVDLIVTSPPYYQKRDYGVDGQIGQEDTPDAFVETIIECLEAWRDPLRPHGSVFLNIGDTYQDRSRLGVPWKVAQAARDNGWLVRNEILWVKDGGLPDPAPNRFANRHEHIFHLTRDNDYYFDRHGYAHTYSGGTSPGDIWEFGMDRNTGSHLAPFPEELVERALTAACPRAVCTECGHPRERQLQRTDKLDESRPQARRAMELYEDSDLTFEHIRAIQSVGITDVGKTAEVQDGTGRNRDEVEELAAEAKEVLGSYFREFTQAKKETAGWSSCECDAPTEPGTVFDPFMGTGTVIEVVTRMGFSSVGADLAPPDDLQLSLEAASQSD